MNRILCLAMLTIWLCGLTPKQATADAFGSGANSFDICFVTIGQPGNPADTTGLPNPGGSVPYVYRIGKYEISEQMIDKANALGGLGITKNTRGPDMPATSISWFEAARFTNWLNTSTGHAPAYKFDLAGDFQLWLPSDPGYNSMNLFRNSLARYVLPTADEWYKAAYFDPVANAYWNYPTGSNVPPTPVASGTSPDTAVVMQGAFGTPADVTQAGGLSPYGTMAQGGNVFEWEETELDYLNNSVSANRGRRGGSWDTDPSALSSTGRFNIPPSSEVPSTGLRIVHLIAEPTGLALALSAFLLPLMCRR
jgi:sulfatase modifying factor 1